MKKRLTPILLALLLAVLFSTPAFAKTVCKIGSKGYNSLQAAINAVKDGETIKVTKAISTNEMVTCSPSAQNGKYPSYTIDFKNKKYKYTGYEYAFRIRWGSVKFKNINFILQRGFLYTNNYGPSDNKLIIDSGKYTGGALARIDDQFADWGDNILVINNGTFNIKDSTTATILNNSVVTINGGKFNNCRLDNYGTCNLNNGKWSERVGLGAGGVVVWNYKDGNITVSGGTYTGNNTFYNEGNLTFTGGTMNSAGSISGGKITVKGGTFNKVTLNGVQSNPVVMSINGTITGGTFNGAIHCPGGSKATIDGGKCNGYIFAEGGDITINKMTVNTKSTDGDNPVCLIAKGGSIKVNNGSFTCTDGYGYRQENGGKVTFGVSNPASLFKVKTLELK